MIGTFIRQYYEKAPFVPNEILVPSRPEDTVLLEELLRDIKGRRVKILAPKRGEKVRLVQRASQNAENSLKAHKALIANGVNLLSRLQQQLRMERIPWRIECFDISNISENRRWQGWLFLKKGNPINRRIENTNSRAKAYRMTMPIWRKS
jgi:excinuclease ABC subunit C